MTRISLAFACFFILGIFHLNDPFRKKCVGEIFRTFSKKIPTCPWNMHKTLSYLFMKGNIHVWTLVTGYVLLGCPGQEVRINGLFHLLTILESIGVTNNPLESDHRTDPNEPNGISR